MSESVDLAVLGGGPGGYVAAIRAAQCGMSVTLIEKDPFLGGTCLHRGCIPTKALLHYANTYGEIQKAAEYGVLTDNLRLDVARMQAKKNDTVTRLARGIDGLIKKNRIRSITGTGKLVGEGVLEVDGTTLRARHIILATGSSPIVLPGVTVDGKKIFTSDEILNLDHIPKTMLVIGAGAVGLEFASIYHRFGARVTVLEMLDRPLPAEDEEISAEIARSFKKQGIELRMSTKVETIETTAGGVKLTLSTGETLEAEVLLLSVGRKPNVDGLPVELENRRVKVDESGRTSMPSVYAIGDLTPGPQLAHVASAEGILAVEHIAGHEVRPIDYSRIPGATYTSPEVASVGLTEKQALEKGYTVKVGRFPWAALGKAAVIGETEGLVKIVADERYGEILGVHIMGPSATDLIAEACVAMQCEATVEELYRTVHAHPTLSEGIMEAGHGVFGIPIHYIPPPVRKKEPVTA